MGICTYIHTHQSVFSLVMEVGVAATISKMWEKEGL